MNFKYIISAFAISITLLTACNSKKSEEKKAADAKIRTKEDDKADSLLLVYNPAKGDKWIADFVDNLHKKIWF